MTTGEQTSPVDVRRLCAWCRGPIPAAARRDALTCSKSCRQARHRFTRGVGQVLHDGSPVVAGNGRRLAYADPPYPGKSRRYYGDHPDYAGEVDHAALIASLSAEYDAWALSTSAVALPAVLALCPPGVRVAAWHRGERAHLNARFPLNAWEPVIYAGQIAIRPPGGRDASRVDVRRVDSFVYRPGNRLTEPGRVVGAKPAAFCGWLFRLLGAGPRDTFVDVFPGSGGVARAWEAFTTVEGDA